MAESYKVSIKVISQKGSCEAGHKVGDQWLVGEKTPGGMCLFAFSSLFPFITPLMYGGAFPWEKDPDKTTVACPDPDNPVVFEIRRVRDQG
ncbi:MAG: TIGR04076 family protein [Dehalococcoidales bacterium]|jgi:uncharacterized repeat protein (TIGR04076 family)|nr:TIGR04076 family protein [Dehalococcoidales bacterium]